MVLWIISSSCKEAEGRLRLMVRLPPRSLSVLPLSLDLLGSQGRKAGGGRSYRRQTDLPKRKANDGVKPFVRRAKSTQPISAANIELTPPPQKNKKKRKQKEITHSSQRPNNNDNNIIIIIEKLRPRISPFTPLYPSILPSIPPSPKKL